jgi:excisionase family DNA binding protein
VVPSSPSGLIRAAEAAELLGVETRTIYNWVAANRIPVVRLSPRTIRFDPEALRSWIQDHVELAGEAS